MGESRRWMRGIGPTCVGQMRGHCGWQFQPHAGRRSDLRAGAIAGRFAAVGGRVRALQRGANLDDSACCRHGGQGPALVLVTRRSRSNLGVNPGVTCLG